MTFISQFHGALQYQVIDQAELNRRDAKGCKTSQLLSYVCFPLISSGMVRAFQSRVEAQLPGLYSWFDERSLHITIRALIG